MAHSAFAVAVASSPVRAQTVLAATSPATTPATTATFGPAAVAVRRGAAHLAPAQELQVPLCGGGDFTGSRGGGDGGGWRPDRTPDGNGDDGAAEDGALVPFIEKLLRGSAAAALAGYSVSSLLEERSHGALHLLSAPDFKEAGVVGLFGFVVHGLGGLCFYQLLDEIVAGSTPIPVAIKTCIDALFFLPLMANAFDRFTKYASSSNAPRFLRFMQGREHSSVHLLRNRALWVPAQAISFWFLPPWWRVGYVSIIMVFVSFLQLVRSSPGAIVNT